MAAHNLDIFNSSSFLLSNRIARVVLNISCVFLLKYSPKPTHTWRSFSLRIFGAKVGKKVYIYPKASIWAPWNLILKDGLKGTFNSLKKWNEQPRKNKQSMKHTAQIFFDSTVTKFLKITIHI